MQQEDKTIGSPKISDMLLSNCPVSDPDGYQVYTEILDTKVQDPAVRNIGIIAPYGAGKSSLLETYKETVLKTKKRKSGY